MIAGFFAKLIGSRAFWIAVLIAAAVAAFYAYTVQQQNLGAYREQAKQQQKDAAAEKLRSEKQAAAMAKRLGEAKADAVAARDQVAKYQEAAKHDDETRAWLATCGGALPVPCRVREYVLGRLPADCPAATRSNAGTGRHDGNR